MKSEGIVPLMMVQATIVEMEKIVMEEEEVRGTGGLHMVEEEDFVEEMMMNLKTRMMTTAPNSILVADVIEEATMKKDLAN